MTKTTAILAMLMLPFSVQSADAPFTATAVVIDGVNSEASWQAAQWQPIPYLMAGSYPEPEDFSGRYRLLWDQNYLYLQVEVTDDVLIDQTADPLDRYWADDCLEIFIDEDSSGGDHQYNHNAFAYHIALDNQVVDLGPDKKPHLYNSHVESRWQRQPDLPHTLIWEVAIKLYDDDYRDEASSVPVTLSAGKNIGFMVAYCDNDGSGQREHFLGSTEVAPVDGDRNRGWLDASVFGKVRLLK